jgi:hypothetical protein
MPITPPLALRLMQALASLFLAILFLQSGLDKVFDRRGNLEYLTSHFATSPLASTVGPMFGMITLLEVAAGALSGIGCLLVVVGVGPAIAFYGATVAAIALCALFFGQRVAKDYAGAAVLVPYFLLALVAMWLLRPVGLVAI